ncbi:hypothetical protein SDC9_179524 [bioreactor metagenome]|uniref:Uncharacterized protein n=1 Tax=bioreactor metagenome TaxID=1076179 RepID=A0A645GZ81_9ZZZZ
MMELFLNRSQIIKDIGMVKFQIIQDRRLGMVMHELGTFVKEGRIIFICFYTEVFTPT